MSRGRYEPKTLDKARDELFSHIRRCGVMEAEEDQRNEWFDDTMSYLGERYPDLNGEDMASLRQMGERYCAPPIRRVETEAADEASTSPDGGDAVEPDEVSVA